jgi:hypothetical protein
LIKWSDSGDIAVRRARGRLEFVINATALYDFPPGGIDRAELVVLLRRLRKRSDHRVHNLGSGQRQNQQPQQQIKPPICHSESPDTEQSIRD